MRKTKMLSQITDLKKKEFDESGKVSNDVSDNGLPGDKQDSFAASEEEKGEE